MRIKFFLLVSFHAAALVVVIAVVQMPTHAGSPGRVLGQRCTNSGCKQQWVCYWGKFKNNNKTQLNVSVFIILMWLKTSASAIFFFHGWFIVLTKNINQEKQSVECCFPGEKGRHNGELSFN